MVESLATESLPLRQFLGDILLDLYDVLRQGTGCLVWTRGNAFWGEVLVGGGR